MAAKHALVQLAQVVNHLIFYQMVFVRHAPKIVKAVTATMIVLHVRQINMVYLQDVLSIVMVTV
jgi:hypothetical protein